MKRFSSSYLFALLSLTTTANMAAAALQPGDIAIVSFNSGGLYQVQFLALTDIANGEDIKFTDHGWTASGSFSTIDATEGTMTWTSNGVSAGTVVDLNYVTQRTSHGSVLGDFFLGTGGDQVLAYQGDEANPTFLFALNNAGTAGEWQQDATDETTSAEPNCQGCTLAVVQAENSWYGGPISGTKEGLLGVITQRRYWRNNNARPSAGYSVGPFIVHNGPFISEFHYSNARRDVQEFVEITGPSGSSLDGWSVVLYTGCPSELKSYGTISLGGTIRNQIYGLGALAFDAGSMEDRKGALCLVDATGAVVEFVGYGGSFTARLDGPCGGMTSADVGVAESRQTPVGQSLQLIDGVWVGPRRASKFNVNSFLGGDRFLRGDHRLQQ